MCFRAIFTAFSTASAPEFANIVFFSWSPVPSAFSRSASSMYGSFAVTWKHVCVSSSSCRWAAATTSGAVWPTFSTAMPVAKSISRFPSTSSTIAPGRARGHDRVEVRDAQGDGGRRAARTTRATVGPGISVTSFRSCGMSMTVLRRRPRVSFGRVAREYRADQLGCQPAGRSRTGKDPEARRSS